MAITAKSASESDKNEDKKNNKKRRQKIKLDSAGFGNSSFCLLVPPRWLVECDQKSAEGNAKIFPITLQKCCGAALFAR